MGLVNLGSWRWFLIRRACGKNRDESEEYEGLDNFAVSHVKVEG